MQRQLRQPIARSRAVGGTAHGLERIERELAIPQGQHARPLVEVGHKGERGGAADERRRLSEGGDQFGAGPCSAPLGRGSSSAAQGPGAAAEDDIAGPRQHRCGPLDVNHPLAIEPEIEGDPAKGPIPPQHRAGAEGDRPAKIGRQCFAECQTIDPAARQHEAIGLERLRKQMWQD